MNVRADDEAFTYVDLFAGRGDFEDQAQGSPVLAFNVMERHILQESAPGNQFNKIRIVAMDKDATVARHLERTLRQRTDNSPGLKTLLEVYTGDREWEIYDADIKQLLSQSKWGFVFADPFSTEWTFKN